MRRRTLIVGNWKMNGLIETAQELADDILAGMAERADRCVQCEVVICPPVTTLYALNQRLGDSTLKLGGQNMSEHVSGPHTGEICGIMLRNVGCWFVILGHSERRSACGEGSELVGRKMAAAFRDGLQPIVCVGETLQERDEGRALEVVKGQLEALFPYWPEARGKRSLLVVAYEPVWAIGTGRNATPEQIQEVHGFIRRILVEEMGTDGQRVRILYGGSLKASNATSILALEDVDGGLIGGASLKSADFLAILDAIPDKF